MNRVTGDVFGVSVMTVHSAMMAVLALTMALLGADAKPIGRSNK
jgi:hypothetical protein